MIKYFNKDLIRKITSIVLAGTTSCSSTSYYIHAEETYSCPSEEKIFEYEAIGRKFEATRYADNSILVETKDNNKYGNLKINKDGKGILTTYNKGFHGLITNKKVEKFTIDYYDGESIKIETNGKVSPELNDYLNEIVRYINNNKYNAPNYISIYGSDLADGGIYDIGDIKCLTEDEYQEVKSELKDQYKKNNIKIKESNAVTLALTDGLVMNVGKDLAIGAISPKAVLIGIGLIAILDAGIYIIDNSSYSIDSITLNNSQTDEETDLNGYTEVTEENYTETMDKIKSNYEDNDSTNDYYQAILSKRGVLIDLVNSFGADHAIELLNNSAMMPSQLPIVTNNVYTYDAEDAANIIVAANGEPGIQLNGFGGEYNELTKGLAENSLFFHSYDSFDAESKAIDINTLKLGNNYKAGVYYWHYHFNNKINLYEQPIKSHVFFGPPIVITEDDTAARFMDFEKVQNYDNYLNEYDIYKEIVKTKVR